MKSSELQDIEKSSLFDASWYLQRYPDVKTSTLSPAGHYLRYGWKMGRDPGPDFSTSEYLKKNSDVETSTNPLLDYIRNGKKNNNKIYPSAEITRTYVASVGSVSENIEALPLVSVIVPVYNVGIYLDASLLSVRCQNYPNIEIIVVNDASTDNSRDVIQMHAALDNRIKVIDLKNNTLGGAGIPSNIGIENASGEYIAFADSDDLIDSGSVFRMVELALKTHVDVVIADFVLFRDDDRSEERAYDKGKWTGIPLDEAVSPEDYPTLLDLSPVPWRKLYKKSFLDEKNIFFPEGDYFYEDNPLHWFVISQAKSIAITDYIVAFHRMGREGQTMGADVYKLSALFCHMNTVKQYFIESKDAPVPFIFWQKLLSKAANFDWIIRQEKNTRIYNLLKKRNAQLIDEVASAMNREYQDFTFRGKATIIKKMEDYSKSRKDYDLTIIIPVYNCGDLLESTLEQLTKINKISVEVFLMDDGSSDNSADICRKFSNQYANFLFFTQKNKGAGLARNALIPLASGRYTYFLDADDTIDVNALVKAVDFADAGSHDLTLFKYRIHFYEKNSYRELFNSDKKIWDKLLKANSNQERRVLASGMINYPWNRIIKTSLLHNENIFFGKTIVHNDIPYHWHSIVSAKNIGVFDEFVCAHRKFEQREQITNITDVRRMMVFEAHRHTQHVLMKYKNFIDILPTWRTFIANLLEWASSRIPDSLSTEYRNSQIYVNNNIHELVKSTGVGGSEKDGPISIGLYRIIGNSIKGLHSEEQAYDNLVHMVENESSPERIDKYFVINRMVNNNLKERLINFFESRKLQYLEIPMNINEYKGIGYDLNSLPSTYYWFQRKGTWPNIVMNTAVRSFKNAYLMNNNGARNFALLHGKERYDWTMPWDGNCFLSDQNFDELLKAFNESKSAKYIITPMERVTSNAEINSGSAIINPIEEPQISFRKDSYELFNENRVYGNQPKVELFKRLGIKGVWDTKENLYPWRKLKFSKSSEAGQFSEAGGVFRLFSGNAEAATNGDYRSHTRSYGIIDFVDSMEAEYVAENFEKGQHEVQISEVLSKKTSDKYLRLFQKALVDNETDINKMNSKDRVNTILLAFSKGMLTQEILSHLNEKSLSFKDNVELQNQDVLIATINNITVLLVVCLIREDYKKAVKVKLDLVMLLYYYYSQRQALELSDQNERHMATILNAILKLFQVIFAYDFYADLEKTGFELKEELTA